ncbi:MAG: polysaccharide deacetylase family protein [Actinobacteria bacterium]|nr:polysaccharide deacetylase family protein [Actinomycetota bacterium]
MAFSSIGTGYSGRARTGGRALAAATLLVVALTGALAHPAGALGPGARRVTDVAGYAGAPTDPVVALTFDDGPDPVTTPQILDILASRGAKATFFVVGAQAARYPDLVRRIAREGHVVAGHTWSHARLTGMSEATFVREVDSTNRMIESLTNVAVRCVRPPQGVSDTAVVARLAGRGLTTMQWSIDPQDWRTPGVGAIVERVLAGARPGDVVVLHDRRGASQTPAALPAILDGLAQRGYRTVTICGGGASGPVRPEVVPYGAAPPVAVGDLVSRSPLVPMAATAGVGLRLAAGDGGLFALGGASFLGSAGAFELRSPVVAGAATTSGQGYWLVGGDGGVFAFGDAPYAGRAPEDLRRPVVGMAATPSGKGYWLVGGDGGVFAFGDAPFLGSVSVANVVGMAPTPTGLGYWLVGGDGGVFAFGDAPFLGSAAELALAGDIVAIAPTASGRGYWLLRADGEVFAFGDAPFLGSAAGVAGRRAVGIVPGPGGYSVVTERRV